ncbi:UNVERIFIED_CONTAM: hypothetical protein FKN15_025537 [Acipenser sinensis]
MGGPMRSRLVVRQDEPCEGEADSDTPALPFFTEIVACKGIHRGWPAWPSALQQPPHSEFKSPDSRRDTTRNCRPTSRTPAGPTVQLGATVACCNQLLQWEGSKSTACVVDTKALPTSWGAQPNLPACHHQLPTEVPGFSGEQTRETNQSPGATQRRPASSTIVCLQSSASPACIGDQPGCHQELLAEALRWANRGNQPGLRAPSLAHGQADLG